MSYTNSRMTAGWILSYLLKLGSDFEVKLNSDLRLKVNLKNVRSSTDLKKTVK